MKKFFPKGIVIYIVFTGVLLSLTACSSFSKLDTVERFQGKIGNEDVVFESNEKVHRLEVIKKDRHNEVYSIVYEDENRDYKVHCILIYKGNILKEFHMIDPNTGTIIANEYEANLIYVNKFQYHTNIFYKIYCQKKFNYYLKKIIK